ncbi:TIGR02281 family clan AA aspartic protease [Gammaproteobacteria bacterium AB-CW1]|uniref:TIGR02281 family clan AA aspartic protease n=1 Tax=Natronospira elongata TaxID=3110268 RepID=A0AAP6MJG8_9GAMM|nr:TIGR02281 family clan AA aspartic protease [Gammaproteobacteria bacterium AB-CW1]
MQTGRGRPEFIMLLVGLLLALGVLTLAFERILDQRQHPNQAVSAQALQDGSLEIRLDRNPQGHYLASGHINGEPVRFLIDTGATGISVPGHLARKLGLERGAAIPTRTAGGRVNSYLTQLESVSLGGIRQDDVRATINPHMDLDEVLLGMSFLGPLEMEQRDGTLVIRQPARH